MTRPSPERESCFKNGAYEGYRVRLSMLREGTSFAPIACSEPAKVYEFMKDLEQSDRERVYALHLDAKNRVIGCEEVSVGTLGSALLYPREVYKGAFLSSAAGVLIVHNHPSGDPHPSVEDRAIFRRLHEAGELLSVPLVDSVIVGFGRYYSMRDNAEGTAEKGVNAS